MNTRKIVGIMPILMVLLFATALPAMASGSGRGSASNAAVHEVIVPVPANPVWVSGLLLMIVWVVVAAVILGPLVVHFRLQPRSQQLFANESGHSHSRASTTSH